MEEQYKRAAECLPPGEEQSLEIQGSVTVCSVEVETEIHEENAFNDGHFYCETCCKLYADECHINFSWSGTWRGQVIPLGMRFGPFDGEVSSQEKALESAYSWVICRGGDQYNYTDAERDTHSNWMRVRERNLVAFQQSGRVLFRCCRPIHPRQELRVWYAKDYAQNLSTTWDKIWDRKCSPIGRSDDEVQALSCPYCQSSFPAAVYLHRHVRRSHPEEYTHLSVAQAFEPVEQTPVTNLDQCLLTSDAPSSSQNETEETAEETEGVPTDIYPSTECSFSFVAKLNLYKHLKRHHHGEYLKLVENQSFSALQTEETIDKHDPPYEPPARLKRSTRSPNGSRGHPKKGPIGRPRGRPPKIKSPQQPVKNKVHEQSAESEQSTTDLDGSAVPQRANTDGVMPQELPTASHICSECLRTFSHLHLLKSHDCIQQGDGPHGKEQPYCCSLCLKSFKQSSGLKRHQESHSRHSTHRQSAALADATIYPCDHCPFSFTAERYLHKHVRRHHPEMTTKHLCFNEGDVTSKDHSCTQCSKIFRTIRGFKNHACFRQGDQLYLS
ncbi:hypothetical protein AOLI_G00273520 [Acnodon oligacanthus]